MERSNLQARYLEVKTRMEELYKYIIDNNWKMVVNRVDDFQAQSWFLSLPYKNTWSDGFQYCHYVDYPTNSTLHLHQQHILVTSDTPEWLLRVFVYQIQLEMCRALNEIWAKQYHPDDQNPIHPWVAKLINYSPQSPYRTVFAYNPKRLSLELHSELDQLRLEESFKQTAIVANLSRFCTRVIAKVEELAATPNATSLVSFDKEARSNF